jgi:hypothetical protein
MTSLMFTSAGVSPPDSCTLKEQAAKPPLHLDDRMYEGEGASVRRIAGGMNPIPPPKPKHPDPIDHDDLEGGDQYKLNPVGLVRNSVTIWFDKTDDSWTNGMY